ncbi:Mob1/phocein [Butyriboletus roseoflavus]|nr:Mob1/phocein [Butyriboletus roseoflavus]
MAASVLQRPYRGSRVSSFYPVKSLPPISSLDSAFQLQEYISLLIRLDVHDVDTIVSLPGRPTQRDQDETFDSAEPDVKKSEDGDRKSDISVDRPCWIYEQLRRLAQDLSHPLITMLQQECTRSSCPQMKAGEWLYLCVAHGNDGAMEQCCAIDYILHTVDSATALLNSPRAFPSRLSIPQTSHRHFSSLARRLGRIFAHAYFHHREAFEQAEAESSLYARFLKLTNQFDLVPAEFLVIPESAIHHDDKNHNEEVEPPRLFSAAVHPIPNLQHDILTADDCLPDMDQASISRPRVVDAASQFGTDSPRKLGRNRTDTMVFSEAYGVAEELSKNEDGRGSASGTLLGTSPVTESRSLVSGESWPDLETRTEDLDDEDIGDAHSESTLAGPLSPPVEELSLISLEDTSSVATPSEATLDDAPSESSPQGPPIESSVEEPIQVIDAPADEFTPSEAVEYTSEEADATASEVLTESAQIPPELEESVAESVSENDDPIPSSTKQQSEGAETHTDFELPSSSMPLLELNEPPPSEPIPPECESDITDEVGGLDGNEVGVGGEEAPIGE